jgi:phage shock protein E
MKNTIVPKEVFVVGIGVLLIVGVMFFTLFRPTKKENNDPSLTSLNEKTAQFFDQISYVQADALSKELSNEGLVLFDLRESALYEISHIPHSLSVTPDAVVSAFTAQKPSAQKVVLIDEMGQTSALESAIRALRDNNILNIRVLAGGYFSWDRAIYPTISVGDPESATDHAKVRPISIENAKKVLFDDQVILLDVRTPEEYAEGHREGSLNIPFSKLESSAKTIPKLQMIIVYGQNPGESFQAGVRLFDLGHRLVYTLVGGYVDIQ